MVAEDKAAVEVAVEAAVERIQAVQAGTEQ
jgi:hypothetical protein